MRVSLLAICFLLLALAGCRKQSSEAFHRLDAQQSVLISRDGDDAYLSSELDAIIAGLNAVPENALEKDRAVALTGKLRAEQRRVREERAAQEKAEAPTPPEPTRPLRDLSPAEPVAVVPAAPPAEDAGPPADPWGGIEEKEFLALFGRCFSPGDATTAPDGGVAKTWEVRDQRDCARHARPGVTKTLFLFVDGKLWGTRGVTVVDAGPPPAPVVKPVAAADAGERILTIPGAPLREGYERER